MFVSCGACCLALHSPGGYAYVVRCIIWYMCNGSKEEITVGILRDWQAFFSDKDQQRSPGGAQPEVVTSAVRSHESCNMRMQ